MKRLVNEKTLELNITHEFMEQLGINVLAFPQQEKSNYGADVFFPVGNPLAIQYKMSRLGKDGIKATFVVNRTKWKNQHRVLDVIANSGICDAFYFFPLVVSDSFLISNFGNLLSQTIAINASSITGRLNWINQTHEVEVYHDGSFTVMSSGELKGKGIPATNFVNTLKEQLERTRDVPVDRLAHNVFNEIEEAVKKSKIVGGSEHTFTFFIKNRVNNAFGFLQIPTVIVGIGEREDYYKRINHY